MCSVCGSGYIETISSIETNEVTPEGERVKVPREQEHGIRNPRKLMGPRLPSRKEVDEQKLSHLPYRNWCPHCVAGKGEMAPHFKQPA